MRGNTIAVIALVLLVMATAATGWGFYSAYNTVARVETVDNRQGLVFELAKAEKSYQDAVDKLAKAEQDLAKKQAEYQAESERLLRADLGLQLEELGQSTALGNKAMAEGWKAAVPDKNDLVEQTSKKAVDDYKARKDDSEKRRDQRIKDITEERAKIIKDLEDFKKKVDAEKTRLKIEETKNRNVRNDKEQDVAALVTREDPVGLPFTGRILTSDPEHDLAVINLGARHGVKPGMRFEVIQVRGGNTRVHKGHLEVKTVTPEVSTCTILVKEVRLRRCPVCSYTAEQPEQRYCPRCTAPGSTQGSQGLSDIAKIVLQGKSVTDPIVQGDLLYNPLFSPGEKRRYAISGRPLVEGRDYTREAIKQAVEFHGNLVDERLSATTDVLIALREGEDVPRARQLGTVIVNGFDLFRYLER